MYASLLRLFLESRTYTHAFTDQFMADDLLFKQVRLVVFGKVLYLITVTHIVSYKECVMSQPSK